jgi:hypothetical protein
VVLPNSQDECDVPRRVKQHERFLAAIHPRDTGTFSFTWCDGVPVRAGQMAVRCGTVDCRTLLSSVQ